MTGPEWFPIVYGRTRRADRWWRALPGEPDPEWMRSAVRATVHGGRGLLTGPRLVLSQDGRHRLIGLACQASVLSDTMNSDGQRALYCFVGWAASITSLITCSRVMLRAFIVSGIWRSTSGVET